jgi:uncharacterized RDD family membrane protein YckC
VTLPSPEPAAPDAAAPAPAAPPVLAGTFRRLAAAVYDSLLLLALLMLFTALLQVFTDGEAISFETVGAWEYAFQASILGVIVLYFGTAWTRRGETLGMKAWKIRVERDAGGLPAWPDVLRRLAFAVPLYGLAIAGLLLFMARQAGGVVALAMSLPLIASFAWHAVRGRGTLHDLGSRTRVLRIAKT